MNRHSTTQSRRTRRSQGRAAARRNAPTMPRAIRVGPNQGRKKIRVQYRGFIGPNTKIPGVYQPKYQNTGSLSDLPLTNRWFIDKLKKNPEINPGIGVFWPINPRYWENSDQPPILNPIFFCPWFGPTLMARGSVGALRLAAARPRDQ